MKDEIKADVEKYLGQKLLALDPGQAIEVELTQELTD
jgi:hypothetical protein